MSLLEIENLTVRYSGEAGAVTAVRDVSLSLAPGQALGIVGESGSGKSSIAGAILDLLGPGAAISGRIVFEGRDLAGLGAAERRPILGRRIGSVFQDPFTALNPALRVGRQIAEPMVRHLGLRPAQARARAVELLADMGLDRPEAVARAYPHQLSGGMKQRALIAAALACEPALLILDEPTTALDVTVEAQILDLLAGLRRRKSVALLFISHNLGVIRRVCDDVAVMYASQIVELGQTEDVMARPRHPYAKGLLASMPPLRAGTRFGRLPAIAGQMADAADPDAACAFSPRCPFAEARCATSQSLAGGARCWKADELGDWPAPPADDTAPPVFHRGDALLNVTGVMKSYGARRGLAARLARRPPPVPAVAGVSLSISPGEVLGLVGESGCGKSTLGRLVLRLARQDAGTVEFDGADITLQPDAALRPFRQQAQIVFQNVGSSLNPRHSVGEALARPLALFGLAAAAERPARVDALLDMVRLPRSYGARYPHELSGGERQRVVIARALATEPRFLVCDEPVSALDVSVQAAIVNLLADLRDRLGLAYLFISHDLAVVAQLSDRIAVMYRGRLCETGRAAEVLAPPFHPYTEALLLSAAHESPAEPAPLAQADIGTDIGTDIGADDATAGCPFRARCRHRMAVCGTVTPALLPVGPTHSIACHLVEPAAAHAAALLDA